MRISRERRYTIKMADYESYQFGATVELTHLDMGISDAALVKLTPGQRSTLERKLTDAVLRMLTDQLELEIKESADITANRKSFILRAIRGEH